MTFRKTNKESGGKITMETKIIPFGGEEAWEELEVGEMSRSQLEAYLKNLRQQVRELDAREPRNLDSEEYEDWADEHEELEDLIDEALDQLDALR